MLLHFEEFVVDEDALELTRGGEVVPLSPMAVRMLALFARRSGQLVTRALLYEAFWPDGGVDRERLVNTYVRQIRAALGERAGDDRFLKTYPRRGYRFVPVTVVVDPSEADAGVEPVAAGPVGRWIAAVAVLSVVGLGLLAGLPRLQGPSRVDTLDAPRGIAYRMGMELLDRPAPQERAAAVDYFRRAVAEAPSHAAAHAGLAEGLFWSGDAVGATRAARRALELRPDHARAHLVLGASLLSGSWEWVEAERHLRRAVDSAPNDPDAHAALGYLLVAAGRRSEALQVLDHTADLAPTSPTVTGDLGTLYGWIGENERALEFCRRTIRIEPTATWGHSCAMEAALALGNAEEVRARASTLISLGGGDPAAVLQRPANAAQDARAYRRFQLAHATDGGHFVRAVALAFLGDRPHAVQALGRAVRAQEPGAVALASVPWLRTLEGEPGYRALRQEVHAKLPHRGEAIRNGERNRPPDTPSPGGPASSETRQ